MNVVGEVIILIGALVALLAAAGLHRFDSPYARFHGAGKASPVAFLVTAFGAGLILGLEGAALLAVASAAMILTLPLGVHLLFRAVHRTTEPWLSIDELAPRERRHSPDTDES